MTGKWNGIWIILACLALILGGCKATEGTGTPAHSEALASLYNPSQLSLHPDYTLFHKSENLSLLYIRAYPSELRFRQTNEEAEYRALLSIHYRLINLDSPAGSAVIVDSAAVTFKLTREDENKPAFFATLSIPVKDGERYLLRIQAKDLNRGSLGLKYLYVDKRDMYSAQNFNVISGFSGYPKFLRFFLPGEKFSVQYRDSSVDSVYVDYFRMRSELPRPPVTSAVDYTMSYTPDTSYKVHLQDTAFYDLRNEGIYSVKVDPEKEEGLTLFNFGESFPKVITPTELLEPLFYLATLAEYRDLRLESNRKLAVDNMWLKFGNNVEKSRELIRVYYNRVVYSNLYFTSNKQGWKTDQGMIFILFGPPSRIQMTTTGERWFYFTRRRSNPIEFRFDRRPDVLSNQNLTWVKTTDSQLAWNEAVRSWRNGKVYSP